LSDAIRLVRHTAVALAWQGRCYGASDVPLSRAGKAAAIRLSAELAATEPAWVVHSGLTRARLLAERVAAHAGCPLFEDGGWRERDFGAWEGRTWAGIYRTSGNAMDGMIDAPGEFRPGGGETTFELADRATAAYERLPGGNGVVVTHGGPIAALFGRRQNLPVTDWLTLVPPCGSLIVVSRRP
jgi:broad specificity phosphatase PhoE